ncbi:MAG: hypothetical protein NZ742_05390 [Acidobacteria bacterium]|nr:hypothetical protein [Acidobacteriota bacterium]
MDRPVEFAFGEGAVLILDHRKGHVPPDGCGRPAGGPNRGLIFPTALGLVREYGRGNLEDPVALVVQADVLDVLDGHLSRI